jgi:hypothetical protein
MLTGGIREMVALAVLVESVALVAVTVTVCAAIIEGGAVYSPAAEILPTAGLSDQATAALWLFNTVAVKACVCEGRSVTEPGVSDTLTGGTNEMAALAVVVESARLVAVTVII